MPNDVVAARQMQHDATETVLGFRVNQKTNEEESLIVWIDKYVEN